MSKSRGNFYFVILIVVMIDSISVRHNFDVTLDYI